MRDLLAKELRLATPRSTYAFLLLALAALMPGYPILFGSFFFCLGLFFAFQRAIEADDILFTVLLPVAKGGVVYAKFAAAALLEGIFFLETAMLAAVRMALGSRQDTVLGAPLMAANPVFLAFVLLVFAAFNTVFIGGFFRTARDVSRPFVRFIACALLIIGAGETLHRIPGLESLNAMGGFAVTMQLVVLACAALVFAVATRIACRVSRTRFEELDL